MARADSIHLPCPAPTCKRVIVAPGGIAPNALRQHLRAGHALPRGEVDRLMHKLQFTFNPGPTPSTDTETSEVENELNALIDLDDTDGPTSALKEDVQQLWSTIHLLKQDQEDRKRLLQGMARTIDGLINEMGSYQDIPRYLLEVSKRIVGRLPS